MLDRNRSLKLIIRNQRSKLIIHRIHHLSIKQIDDATGVGCIVLGVRNHHDGGSLLVQFAEQLHHLHTILGIEVTRRLIGKDDARLAHHSTGDGNPLLLTARKLMRIMLGTMAQLHLSQYFEHTFLALRLSHSEVFQLQIHIFLPQNVTLEADRNMLRQVFINLTKNAIEAHATDIDVRMSQNERPVLLFSNNGAPIPADVAREIFIPFFTTKSSGTGIGLSLSRQMLMMQNIELGLADTSISGYHVTFYLEKQKD